jgi:hypothetical protein
MFEKILPLAASRATIQHVPFASAALDSDEPCKILDFKVAGFDFLHSDHRRLGVTDD